MCLQRYTFSPTLFPMYVDLYRIIESLNATVSIPVLTENMMQQKVFEFTVDKRLKKDLFYSHIFHIRHALQHHACFYTTAHYPQQTRT